MPMIKLFNNPNSLQIPHHMSPLKCLKVASREPSPTILDLNFTEEEDEDDEEYKPTAEDINQVAIVV